MKTFGLIGKNIGYSLSEKLHQAIAKINNKTIEYQILDIEEDKLGAVIDGLRKDQFQGFNVTIPYKEKIIPYLDQLTDAALKIGAVNTVYKKDDLLIGDNTDYLGFYHLLKANDILSKENKSVYILGSGGAAKAVYYTLLEAGINPTVVLRDLKNDYFEKKVSYPVFNAQQQIDLLINATPVGSLNNPGCLLENKKMKIGCIIDLIYNPAVTKLMSYANKSIGGFEMLIVQAIKAQEKWFNEEIRVTDELLKQIKGELKDESVR